MKKLLLFSALISLSIFTACDKQQIEGDLVPATDEEVILPSANRATNNDYSDAADDPLTADFAINNDKSRVNEFEHVSLTNKAVNAVSYEWDFGNGDTSTDANPSYHYKIHGQYTITLKTTDVHGNVQQSKRDILVLCLFGGGSHNQ